MSITAKDIREFNAYLKQITDRQVKGVYEYEMKRGGDGEAYAELAKAEAENRGIELEECQ